MDTVLNEFMRPVFPGSPEEVRRRLHYGFDDTWKYVLVGETKMVVGITEYLYEDKYKDVTRLVKELLRKKDQPLYKRDPEILEQHIERAVKRIIERCEQD